MITCSVIRIFNKEEKEILYTLLSLSKEMTSLTKDEEIINLLMDMDNTPLCDLLVDILFHGYGYDVLKKKDLINTIVSKIKHIYRKYGGVIKLNINDEIYLTTNDKIINDNIFLIQEFNEFFWKDFISTNDYAKRENIYRYPEHSLDNYMVLKYL